MKAPDKIYVDDLAVVNDCVTKISLKQLPNFSEYIRKDALLEWVNELKLLLKDKSGAQYEGAEVVVNGIIDKIESL